MRKTKIVATLGPSSNDVEQMKNLIKAGISAARMNFSHGDHEEQGIRIKNMKQAREELNAPIPLILDTKGPEIRIKTFGTENGKITLNKGDEFTLTTEDIEGDQTKVSVTYEMLPEDVSVGNTILIDDGLIELKVTAIDGCEVKCVAQNSGIVGSKKSVNLPNVHIHLPALTQKDIDDLKFGVEQGVDFIAASFIRSANDVLEIRKVLEEAGGSDILIISKIENRDGVDNIDEILEVTDALMVARGDLGVEIPFEEVPLVQKMLIRKCIEKGKPVITATQMLDSMIRNPRPTRAEVNDVANAIFDFTDAIMLSGETANGDFPVEAVKAMDRIARQIEESIDYSARFDRIASKDLTVKNITSAVSHSACTTAHDLKASLISTVTMSGRAVREVSKYRPATSILACTPLDRTLRQMNLIWGCIPMNVEFEKKNVNSLFNSVAAKALSQGIAQNGELMVFTGGTPLGTTGSTNTIKVGIVGDTIARGENKSGAKKNVTAHTNIITNVDEAKLHFHKGDIFVTSTTSNDLMPYMMRASAIIVGAGTERDYDHAIIIGKELNIPVILSKEDVAQIIPDNLLVTIDSASGVVYIGEKH